MLHYPECYCVMSWVLLYYSQKTLDKVHTVQFNLHSLRVYCGPFVLPVIGDANMTST